MDYMMDNLLLFMSEHFFLYFLMIMAIPLGAQMYLSATYGKYTRTRSSSGQTGYQVARDILDRNGLHHVRVEPSKGKLSDHYDPRSRTVRLSPSIHNGVTVAAKAVAAHEVGHAVQHAEAYGPLKIRSAMVPVVTLANRFGFILIMIGMFTAMFVLAEIGLVMIFSLFLFQLVTLPVEFNASKRAMALLDDMHLVHDRDERSGVRKVLNAAALTYVAAMLVSLLELIRLAAIVSNSRGRSA